MTLDEIGQDYPVAMIGFGEAGSALAEGLLGENSGLAVAAFDIKTDSDSPAVAEGKRRDYASAGVRGGATLAEALSGARLIFSLVTADEAERAAAAAAAHLAPGALFLDCNSCSPGAKRRSGARIAAAGGVYVDMAIMAPVHPRRHRTPALLSGPAAEEACRLLGGLGMQTECAGAEIGRASTIKMVRSVMIKGIEALVMECVLAGRRAGVESEVLGSLDASFPEFDWTGRVAYMMERVTTHGLRRAAEMREVARTVAELGLPPAMANATAKWQQIIGELGIDADGDARDFAPLADAVLAALGDERREEPR